MIFIPVVGQDESYKQYFKELDITGVIYLEENTNQDMLNYIAAKNIKMVMFGAISEDQRCKMIHINDLAAAHEGARYLLELKHERILIISDYPKSISSGFQRIAGCKRAFEEYGLEFDADRVKYGELTYNSGYRITTQALQQGISFTAVFAFSDEAALGVISALAERGLRVPEDVSVVGFNNYLYPELADREITTYEVNIKAMTKVALEKVLKQIKNPKRGHGMDIVSGRIVIKKSVNLKK